MTGTPNYSYYQGVADLKNRYRQDNATQEYGRFLGQQRFSRQKEDLNKGFQHSFPAFTARYAKRFGSNVRSGRTAADLTDYTNNFANQMGAVDEAQAAFQGDFNMKHTQGQANYLAALQRLKDQLHNGQAIASPFDVYTNIWGSQ